MISDSVIDFVKNKFNDYQNYRKLISAKEIHNFLSNNEFEFLLSEARKEYWSINYTDKNDLVKQFIRFILSGNKELKRCKVCNEKLSLNQTIENGTAKDEIFDVKNIDDQFNTYKYTLKLVNGNTYFVSLERI